MIDRLLHVSSGMGEEGGGTAHLGRLAGATLRKLAAERRLAFRGLHLPALDGSVATDGYRAFGGSRTRLAVNVLARVVAARSRTAIYFDHVGPARSLALLPAPLLPRYAVQIHGIEIWRPLSRDRLRVLERAAFLVANSAFTAEHSRQFLPARHAMRVAPLGIEPIVLVGPVDRETAEKVGEGFALIVSRLASREAYKGHDELLEAWPEVKRLQADARLVVVGEGDDLPRLRAKAAELGVADAVRFTGQVDPATLGELYRRSAFFAMPSGLEGFGLVYPEAMAAGKACLALAGTAPAEIVVDGETGRLVPARDRAALAAALVDLFADPERTRALGEAGRRRYEREYTARAFERRFLAVARELVEG